MYDLDPSQGSQNFSLEPGQKRLAATFEDLDMAKKEFFARMITKINSLHEDNRVNSV